MQANDDSTGRDHSYCFIDAAALYGARVLALEQYLFHLLEHFKGVRHQLDKLEGGVLSRREQSYLGLN